MSGDEREAGRRAILNAGHTVAHALEHATAYGIAHGEAVALGLVAECALAEGLGVAPAGLRKRVAALLERLGLPVRLAAPNRPRAGRARRWQATRRTRAGTVRFALPRELGAMDEGERWTRAAPEGAIKEALRACRVAARVTLAARAKGARLLSIIRPFAPLRVTRLIHSQKPAISYT